MGNNVIKNEVREFVEGIRGFEITDVNTFEEAGLHLLGLKRFKNKITDYFKPLKEAAKAAHAAVCEKEKKELTPVITMDLIIRDKRARYKVEQDRIQEELQRKAELEAKKKAEKEREKLLRKAEKAKSEVVKEELVAQAEEVVEVPIFVPPVVARTAEIPGGGMSTFVKDVEVACTDLRLICNGIAKGIIPVTVVDVKPAKLKAWVKANGIMPNQVPGVHVRDIQVERIRG